MSDLRPRARRILIVEDEYMIAADLRRALERAGGAVLGPVPSVADALALLNAGERIDGAVLDINLGGETVFPLVPTLRALGVPFVFATGYGAEDIPDDYRDVVRFEKPADPAEVAGALGLDRD